MVWCLGCARGPRHGFHPLMCTGCVTGQGIYISPVCVPLAWPRSEWSSTRLDSDCLCVWTLLNVAMAVGLYAAQGVEYIGTGTNRPYNQGKQKTPVVAKQRQCFIISSVLLLPLSLPRRFKRASCSQPACYYYNYYFNIAITRLPPWLQSWTSMRAWPTCSL